MNSSLDNVYELLRLGYGDVYRLENLKKRLESGTILYASDNDYLQKLVYQHRGEIQVAEHKKPEPTPEYKAMREAYRSIPERNHIPRSISLCNFSKQIVTFFDQ